MDPTQLPVSQLRSNKSRFNEQCTHSTMYAKSRICTNRKSMKVAMHKLRIANCHKCPSCNGQKLKRYLESNAEWSQRPRQHQKRSMANPKDLVPTDAPLWGLRYHEHFSLSESACGTLLDLCLLHNQLT